MVEFFGYSGHVVLPGQTIIGFRNLPTKLFGDAPFRIKIPKSSSGLPVTVTVQSGPATIVGDKILMTGAGNVVLAADAAGDANFSPASEVEGVIYVNKAN